MKRIASKEAPSDAESFRIPMTIKYVYRLKNGEMYPVCPRCHYLLDREYQRYCDYCGQALGWKGFSKVPIVDNP